MFIDRDDAIATDIASLRRATKDIGGSGRAEIDVCDAVGHVDELLGARS